MSELDDLAELLRSKSVEGKVQWKPYGNSGWAPNSDIRLQTRLGDNYIEISKYAGIPEETIALSVRNRDGIVLARGAFDAGGKSFAGLDEIIGVVRRQSLGVDGALSDLRAHLEAL